MAVSTLKGSNFRHSLTLESNRRLKMTKEEIKKILLGNREILRKYKVKSIALFGSYGRNEQREDSDIDLLIEFEESTGGKLFNILTAVNTKPFIILSGISGTGKTQIARIISAGMVNFEKGGINE